jgi:RNA polymerase sigma-70 factor (ECF subfamily)
MTKEEFENLYDAYAASVARFLSNYTRKTDQLEDWVQTVFLKLWKYRDSVDIEGEYLKTYLLKIARNVAVTELKKEKKSIFEYQPDLNEAAEPGKKEERLPPTSQQRNPDMFMEKYYDALEKVPPRAREVYQLNREEGLSYREIAETLQISPKTVEVHISKVLRILRKELREYKR